VSATPQPAALLRPLRRRAGSALDAPAPAVAIVPGLENQRATPTARIARLHLDAYAFDADDLRPLTEAELDRVVFRGEALTLHVLAAVEETERQTRAEPSWFGGIDVHHVFFEGLEAEAGEVWRIGWGS